MTELEANLDMDEMCTGIRNWKKKSQWVYKGLTMKNILDTAEKLISYAKNCLELDARNELYVRNRLLEIMSGIENEDLSEEESDEVYGALSLMPSEINAEFQRLVREDTKKATDWFNNYCVQNNYVKKAKLDQNPRFESDGLVVTINKAKPEFRDPKKAKAGNSVDGGFAKCVICRENEGYGERNKRTLRTVDLTLDGEPGSGSIPRTDISTSMELQSTANIYLCMWIKALLAS